MMKILITSTLLILAGCGYNHTSIPGGAPGGNGSLGNGQDPDDGNGNGQIGFATIKQKVFQQNCIGCHGGGRGRSGVNLDTYASAKPVLSAVLAAVNRNSMPPRNPLPAEAKQLLADWIRNGAPEEDIAPTNPSGNSNATSTDASTPLPCDDDFHTRIADGKLIRLDEKTVFDTEARVLRTLRDHPEDDCEPRDPTVNQATTKDDNTGAPQ